MRDPITPRATRSSAVIIKRSFLQIARCKLQARSARSGSQILEGLRLRRMPRSATSRRRDVAQLGARLASGCRESRMSRCLSNFRRGAERNRSTSKSESTLSPPQAGRVRRIDEWTRTRREEKGREALFIKNSYSKCFREHGSS